jgi:hypothetical protein
MYVQVHITAGKQMREGMAGKMRELKIGIAGVFLRGAERFRSEAQARAPSDTGALRAGMKITRPTYRQSGTDRRFGIIRAAARTTAPYSRLVEFGTVRTHIKQAARTVMTSTGQSKTIYSRRTAGARKLPPIQDGRGLAAWAERKGFNRWAIQRSVGGASWRHAGGSKAKRFWYPTAACVPAWIGPDITALARRIFA